MQVPFVPRSSTLQRRYKILCSLNEESQCLQIGPQHLPKISACRRAHGENMYGTGTDRQVTRSGDLGMKWGNVVRQGLLVFKVQGMEIPTPMVGILKGSPRHANLPHNSQEKSVLASSAHRK